MTRQRKCWNIFRVLQWAYRVQMFHTYRAAMNAFEHKIKSNWLNPSNEKDVKRHNQKTEQRAITLPRPVFIYTTAVVVTVHTHTQQTTHRRKEKKSERPSHTHVHTHMALFISCKICVLVFCFVQIVIERSPRKLATSLSTAPIFV